MVSANSHSSHAFLACNRRESQCDSSSYLLWEACHRGQLELVCPFDIEKHTVSCLSVVDRPRFAYVSFSTISEAVSKCTSTASTEYIMDKIPWHSLTIVSVSLISEQVCRFDWQCRLECRRNSEQDQARQGFALHGKLLVYLAAIRYKSQAPSLYQPTRLANCITSLSW